MTQPDHPAADATDETVDDGQQRVALDEGFFREQVDRIVAEARREAAGGDQPSSYGGPTYY